MIEATGRRRLAITFASALLVGACGGNGQNGEVGPTEDPSPQDVGVETEALLIIERAGGGEPVEVRVAVADTPEEQTTGLMHVEELGADQGMVFLHDEPTTSGFWMKNTLIPLSLAVWDEEGIILSILDMEPCEADPCHVYEPGVGWVGAVEVNQGFFREHGIEIGDIARLQDL